MAGNDKKDKKGAKYYEVTKERRASSWEIILSVGAIGATLGFFTALLVGACSQSATLDTILVVALTATLLGFGLGILASWIFRKYFGELLTQVTQPLQAPTPPVSETPPEAVVVEATVEPKGQTVDYVFPEFTPDSH